MRRSGTAATIRASGPQSIRFERAHFSQPQAEHWLAAHGYAPIKHVDITRHQLRYRVAEPGEFTRMRVIHLGPKIEMVVGWR
jgi:hypothetical protein